MTPTHGSYYLPEPSPWPIVTSAGLFALALGTVLTINDIAAGPWFMALGAAVIAYMMVRWFGQVIGENEGGLYDDRVDMSFRWGMSWFIFSEVMFFAAFFGALYYVRHFAGPWLAGADPGTSLLWPDFEFSWPSSGPQGAALVAEHPGAGEFTPMSAWGIPALNTLILLLSGVTITVAHVGLQKDNRGQLITWLFLTIALGLTFLGFQAYEYVEAYTEFGLTLKTGVYGTTFFMLTGFHGLHVTIGTIMLMTIFGRALSGHFRPESHFGFEAVAWYWHFVDVVWLILFVFVYWL